jgi:transposase InsO family protein
MPDEVPEYIKDEVVDKREERRQRDWFKLRKMTVNRLREGLSQAGVARLYGVSVGFVCKWWHRWLDHRTWDCLRSRSTAPNNVRVKRFYHSDVVVAARLEHPEMGAQKIKAWTGVDLSHQTIHAVLVEEGLVSPGPRERRVWRSFSRKHSNSLWQMDIKELGEGGGPPYLLTLVDDHSRLVLASRMLANATTEAVVEVLRRAMRLFGRPRQILTDRGCQWHHNAGGVSEVDRMCSELGIRHILAGVRKPTTIGKIERWHRTLEDELLRFLGGDLQVLRHLLPGFIEWYNTGRPHWSLDLRTPMEVYLADFMNPEEITVAASIHEVA